MKKVLSSAFRLLPLLTLLLQVGTLRAADYDPLFSSAERLQITLDGSFALIDRERDKEKDYPGKLSYLAPTGERVVLDVEYQVRGNFRLRKDTCRYSQLWLNLKTKEAKGTLFENQDRIKLAVQCGPQQHYAESLVREQQVYQLFNSLTDRSFAARLVQLTYRDADNPGESRTGLGFFIEHQKRLAKRLQLPEVDVEKTSVAQLDPAQASLVATFMYMIANTDYSMLSSSYDDACCHNIRLFEDQAGRHVPVPYDFDFSGLVNASYATPNAELNLHDIRQRLYRGFCVHNDQMTATLERFREQRSAITTILAETTYVNPTQVARTQDFISDFYDIIDKPAAVNSRLLGKCR